MSNHERMNPEIEVAHDQYELDGVRHSTVSYLDQPMAASAEAKAEITARGRTPEDYLPLLRHDCIVERNEIMDLLREGTTPLKKAGQFILKRCIGRNTLLMPVYHIVGSLQVLPVQLG